VLESQLNYVVSVKVNNEVKKADEQLMSFNPIKDMLPQDFTKIYGDCFISGFLEGGEFNAVISIKVNDSSSLKKVKQASVPSSFHPPSYLLTQSHNSADFQLAVGATPVSVGAKESFAKESSKILEGTEITISVNWIGGGEIKKRESTLARELTLMAHVSEHNRGCTLVSSWTHVLMQADVVLLQPKLPGP
ncbi:hypothetical protein LTR16_009606, partial [Cryomyces antarcticus]